MGVKVQLRVPTLDSKRGDVIEVESAEVADALVANGSASRVKPAAKSDKD